MRRQDKLITSEEEIESILKTAPVCHLALHDDPYPYVIPLNFGYRRTRGVAPGAGREELGTLFFHGASAGRKIELIRRNPHGGFSIDTDHKLITAAEANRFTMHYRSVVGAGRIAILTDPDEKREGLDAIMAHYSERTDWVYPDGMVAAVAVFALYIDELSGKKSPPGK